MATELFRKKINLGGINPSTYDSATSPGRVSGVVELIVLENVATDDEVQTSFSNIAGVIVSEIGVSTTTDKVVDAVQAITAPFYVYENVAYVYFKNVATNVGGSAADSNRVSILVIEA